MAYNCRFGGRRVAWAGSAGLRYLLADHLSSSHGEAGTTGQDLAQRRYYPFGSERTVSGAADLGTDGRFTGQRRGDAGNGNAQRELYHYGARWYLPGVGLFTQPDTIVPAPSNPQALFRYAYALNNPLRYTDPSGHRFEEDTGIDEYDSPPDDGYADAVATYDELYWDDGYAEAVASYLAIYSGGDNTPTVPHSPAPSSQPSLPVTLTPSSTIAATAPIPGSATVTSPVTAPIGDASVFFGDPIEVARCLGVSFVSFQLGLGVFTFSSNIGFFVGAAVGGVVAPGAGAVPGAIAGLIVGGAFGLYGASEMSRSIMDQFGCRGW